MPIVSQNLTLPSNVQTGGTVQAADVSTLYSALNALNIPASIGVWQQGFVDDNAYTCTGGGGTRDFAVSASYNKAIIFMIPFSWAAATAAPGLLLRINGSDASTSAMSFTNQSSGNGMVAGFISAGSTSIDRAAFTLAMDDRTPGTLRNAAATVTYSTSDRSSVGFTGTTGSPATTFTMHGVRIWIEG